MPQFRLFRFRLVPFLILVGLLVSVSIQPSLGLPRLRNIPQSLVFTALQGRGDSVRNSLFLIQADGSNRRNLTPGLTDVAAPIVWSRDGNRLAFVNGSSDIYVMQANGSRLLSVFKGNFCKAETYQMVWSSNQRLIFGRSCEGSTLEEPGRVELYSSTTTSIQGTRLVEGFPKGAVSLSLAPNGQRVAFVKDNDIYTLNLDGSQWVNLTQNQDSGSRNRYNSGGSSLVWSPDSRRIAFWVGQYPRQQLYMVNAEGGEFRQLTRDPNQQLYSVDLIWSPDSQKIAYTRLQSDQGLENRQAIYTVDVNSGISSQLTRKLSNYSLLKWSPNGRQLAFAIADGRHQSIHRLNLANLQELNLTPRRAFAGIIDLAWSPNSQQIAFNLSEPENSFLYVVNVDGTGLRRLSQRSESISFPVWKP